MYEAYNRMDRDDTIDTLKAEAHDYYSEKEGLRCELSSLKLKYDNCDRGHKESIAKLQVCCRENLYKYIACQWDVYILHVDVEYE